MSFASRGLSTVSQLAVLVVLLGAFAVGMAAVVVMSLSGSEVQVPEIVGKDAVESEKLLSSLGLKMKTRATRASTDPVNTVLDQLPRPGETVKTGQMILVVVSKAGGEAVAPPSLKKDIETDDSERIGEMISDKPKKTKANTNATRKKADTSRDTNANESNTSAANDSKLSDKTPDDDPKSDRPAGSSGSDKNRNSAPQSATKPQPTPAKPAPKPPADSRNRSPVQQRP